MISSELEAEILRLSRVEGWPVGTIATQLGVHHDAVERVLREEGRPRPSFVRPTLLDPYLAFIEETLRRYPNVRASRIFDMCVERGFRGGPSQFRARIAHLRPRPAAEAYLLLSTLPGQEAQVDWGLGTMVANVPRVELLEHPRALGCLAQGPERLGHVGRR